MLSSWDLTRTALVLWHGDSLSDPAFTYQMLAPLFETASLNYNPAYGSGQPGRSPAPAGFRVPQVSNKAVTGSTIGDIYTYLTSQIQFNPWTHVALCMGTNERPVARAVTQANITNVATLLNGYPVKILIVGPYAWGECYPSGVNDKVGANDQRLDETDIDIPAGFNAVNPNNFVYVSLRSTLYTQVMPPQNLPPPGATNGPFTVDGAHWNPRGRMEALKIIRPFVNFT